MVKLMILYYFLLLLFILQLLLSTRENMCVLEREIRVSERERERKFESERINKNKKIKKSDNNKKYLERKMGKSLRYIYIYYSFFIHNVKSPFFGISCLLRNTLIRKALCNFV